MPADAWALCDRAAGAGWAPDPRLMVSEWADDRRVLSVKASAEHGQWRTSRTPYLRAMMDDFSIRSPVQEIVAVFASQTGKALAVDTPIATPEGWSMMGSLRVGDRVFDEVGRPTEVVATSPVMTGRDCYRVEFSDGAEIVADGEHLWTVDDETTGSGRTVRRTLRTVDMLDRGVKVRGRNAYAIPEVGRRRIVAITPVESVPVRCIKVAAASSLFLAGREMVPTHNSEALNNCGGYALDIAPGPMLMIQPTIDLAKRYSKMRVTPMIEATPTLATKVKPSRSRDSGNTLLMKEFLNDALLIMGGANAASGLASMPIRYLLMDEIDRFPQDVDGEGSPMALAEVRTRTFGARRKVLSTSTPTLSGRSAIWAKWEQSNQCRYHVPCPHCGEGQVLKWSNMRYDPKDPMLPLGRLSTPPVIICEACGAGIEERAKSKWYGEDLGEWVPENPDSPVKGYHLPGFYSPLGWLSWTEIIVGYERAKDDPLRMKVWTNTVLAECYAEVGEVPDWEALYRRREPYQRGVVPAGGLVLTMAADIQRDRIEVEVVAWGPEMESWSVDYLVLDGDTSTIQKDPEKPCPWRRLTEELQRTYQHENGSTLGISRMAVDSGDQTQVVYQWVRQQADPRVMAIKGRGSLTSPLGVASMQEVSFKGKKLKRGVKLWPVGVDVLKQELYGWLRLDPPLNEGDPFPRGWCHFPEYGEGYFQMLTAEELRPKLRRGFTVYEWEKIRDRNEALDVRVYNRAAATSLGIDRWPEGEWERRREALSPAPVENAAQAAEPEKPVAAPIVRRRRKPRRAVSVGGGR